jgi:hypothetical protein
VRPRRSLDAIRRDDELLDALAAGAAPEDDPMALALAEWRHDLDAAPARPRRFAVLRRQVGRSVASAAVASAVGLISIGGVAAAATQAGPGSALWPITRVVAADRAHSREAADQARELLRRATAAAAAERHDEASRYLDAAERDTAQVRRGDGERELRDRAAVLRRRLAGPVTEPTPAASPSPSASPTAAPTPGPSGTPGATPGGDPSESPSPWPSETREPSGEPSPSPSRTQPNRRSEPSPSPSPSGSPPSGNSGLTEGGRDLLRLLLLSPSPTG